MLTATVLITPIQVDVDRINESIDRIAHHIGSDSRVCHDHIDMSEQIKAFGYSR